MPFLSGTVSFSRFRIAGGGPKRLDENLIEKFRQHRIGADRVQRSDNVEAGWIGGRHLLDLDFDVEKNVLLDCVHAGLRIDAARIPPDLLRAYSQLELESLLRDRTPGRGIGKLKRQAKEAAKKRAESEIKQGRYLSQRQFPILLDSRNDVLYSAATSPAVHERLHVLFRDTFAKRLEPMTAGERAAAWAEEKGLGRKLENLTPTLFVDAAEEHGEPEVYWTSGDPHSRDFLGNEFLLWLWFELAERGDTLKLPDGTEAAIMIVKQLALECPRAQTGKEVITCEGPTTLPEARRAIRSGKLPRKAGMIISRQGDQYAFVLQAETFNVSSAQLPKIEDRIGDDSASDRAGDDGAGVMGGGRLRAEERIEQIRHLSQSIDLLFATFLQRRLGAEWKKQTDEIRAWLRSG